jgi:transposase
VVRQRRYPSDLTDAQWEIIEPMLLLPKWMGRPEGCNVSAPG